MRLALMVSYDDEVAASGETEEELVDRLFAQMSTAGFETVVWRSMRGGRAMFKSTEYSLSYPENLAQFDPLAVAGKKARKAGMEFIVWHEVKGAEAHGFGLHSAFVREHPELLSMNRRGMTSRSELSWAAPKVMDRRVNTFREVASYEPDGIWIDHLKGGDVSIPSFDSDGYYEMGYDTCMVEAFKAETGRNPWKIPNNDSQWLAFRASFVTDYMRRIRAVQKDTCPNTTIGSLAASVANTDVWHLPIKGRDDPNMNNLVPLASALAGLEDHEAWTCEGLIDVLCAPHNTVTPPEDLDRIIQDARSRIRGRCRLAVSIFPSGPDAIRDSAAIARRYGATHLVVRESYNLLGKPALWDALQETAVD